MSPLDQVRHFGCRCIVFLGHYATIFGQKDGAGEDILIAILL